MATPEERIEHILKFMEWDQLTDNEHDWVIKMEESFTRRGRLSERETEILEDIFKRAAER